MRMSIYWFIDIFILYWIVLIHYAPSTHDHCIPIFVLGQQQVRWFATQTNPHTRSLQKLGYLKASKNWYFLTLLHTSPTFDPAFQVQKVIKDICTYCHQPGTAATGTGVTAKKRCCHRPLPAWCDMIKTSGHACYDCLKKAVALNKAHCYDWLRCLHTFPHHFPKALQLPIDSCVLIRIYWLIMVDPSPDSVCKLWAGTWSAQTSKCSNAVSFDGRLPKKNTQRWFPTKMAPPLGRPGVY